MTNVMYMYNDFRHQGHDGFLQTGGFEKVGMYRVTELVDTIGSVSP